jgi:outer membrane lipoprotein-sorting protein
MKPLRILAAVVLAGCAVAPAVFGQGMFGGQGDRAGGRLAKMLDKATGFTATAQVTTLGQGGSETLTVTDYAVRDGMVRVETDLTKTKHKGKRKKQDDGMEEMAGMGLDKQVTLVRADKQATYIIYPGLKAYYEVPKSASSEKSQPDWKELGKDTVDGHPCVKYLVTTTNVDGTKEESTVWKATDLKDFAIQTVIQSGGDTTTTKFTNIKFDKPSAALFDPPGDYTKYGSMQEMMMASMSRMMPQGGMPHGEMPPQGVMPHGGMPPQGGGDNE